jgi:hypothetical protein
MHHTQRTWTGLLIRLPCGGVEYDTRGGERILAVCLVEVKDQKSFSSSLFPAVGRDLTVYFKIFF